MNLKLLTIVALFALVAIFVMQNADVVELRFLFWAISMSRALMFVFLVLVGVAAGWFLHAHMTHKKLHKDT